MNNHLFIDYLQVTHIELFDDDYVCMWGAYHDPATGLLHHCQFGIKFGLLYDLLSNHTFIINADIALERLADAYSTPEASHIIELPEDQPIFFQGFIFYLTRTIEPECQERLVETGFYIEEALRMKGEILSFEQYVSPSSRQLTARQKEKLQPAFHAMSAHLVSLALRYVFYQLTMEEGRDPVEIGEITGLEDPEVFDVAKSAYKFVTDKFYDQLRSAGAF